MLFLRLLGTAWLFPVPLSVCPLLLPLSVSSLLACGPAPLLRQNADWQARGLSSHCHGSAGGVEDPKVGISLEVGNQAIGVRGHWGPVAAELMGQEYESRVGQQQVEIPHSLQNGGCAHSRVAPRAAGLRGESRTGRHGYTEEEARKGGDWLSLPTEKQTRVRNTDGQDLEGPGAVWSPGAYGRKGPSPEEGCSFFRGRGEALKTQRH